MDVVPLAREWWQQVSALEHRLCQDTHGETKKSLKGLAGSSLCSQKSR